MDGFHAEVREHSVKKVHDTLDATYYWANDARGEPQVGVEITKPGLGRSVGTVYLVDMDSLDAVVMRVEEFARDGANKEAKETIKVNGKSHEVTCYRYDNSVVVDLYQKASSGSEQRVVVDLKDLKEIVREGERVEQDLGCKKDHYVLFRAESLTRNIHDQVNAVVKETVKGYTNALNALRSRDECLYEKPLRYPQGRGENVLLDPNGMVRPYAKHEKQTVAQYERTKAPFRDRESLQCVIARWCESYPPKMGDKVSWTGKGERSNGDFEDYFARHENSTSQAPSIEPRWVLINKDTGRILAQDNQKEPLVKELRVASAEIQKAKQLGAQHDLSQESFNRKR